MPYSFVVMNRPGPAITLSKQGGKSFLFPFYDGLNITATQNLFQPVKQVIEAIRNAITSSAGTKFSSFSGIIQTISQLQQLTGYQFGSKGYYASSWAGSQPASLSIKIQSYRGIMGAWNANIEVTTPLLALMASTLPISTGGQSLESPLPSGFDVIGNYTATFLKSGPGVDALAIAGASALTTIDNPVAKIVGTGVLAAATVDLVSGSKLANQLTGADSQSIALETTFNKTWDLQFGYYTGAATDSFIHYYTLPQVIVESSSINFDSMVEKNGSSVFPIKGTVSLNIKTETILANTDMVFK